VPVGTGRRHGGPRAWPDGISEAYWRTLSTEMKRVWVLRAVPGLPAPGDRGDPLPD